MTPPRNIIRVDLEVSRTHAWRVTVQRHNDIVVKTFSDSVHGEKRKALKAAVEYRDELLLDTHPMLMPFGSALAFVGTTLRVFPAWTDMRNVSILIPATLVYFGWLPGSTSKATVVSASSQFLTMESAMPSVSPSQSVSVN